MLSWEFLIACQRTLQNCKEWQLYTHARRHAHTRMHARRHGRKRACMHACTDGSKHARTLAHTHDASRAGATLASFIGYTTAVQAQHCNREVGCQSSPSVQVRSSSDLRPVSHTRMEAADPLFPSSWLPKGRPQLNPGMESVGPV